MVQQINELMNLFRVLIKVATWVIFTKHSQVKNL